MVFPALLLLSWLWFCCRCKKSYGLTRSQLFNLWASTFSFSLLLFGVRVSCRSAWPQSTSTLSQTRRSCQSAFAVVSRVVLNSSQFSFPCLPSAKTLGLRYVLDYVVLGVSLRLCSCKAGTLLTRLSAFVFEVLSRS